MKQKFWNLAGIAALITACGTLVNSFIDKGNSDLMLKSMYEVSTTHIAELRERVAILEATLHSEPVTAMMVAVENEDEPEPECSGDSECPPLHTCIDSFCIAKEEDIKPDNGIEELKIPTFEDLRQHVQEKKTAW